ncbi:P-loop containing nucleoside triphosphate hydrolase protein [Jimgerdemannia flammicorona]|uniref:P-loop containing nucleoside triphosphate hydrolase protein n=1 Tax=Jimgerdemannia flammicorona TaxID=994334 RepID=A0A433D766_9FUNG|nr:P-loop containing nucleoside triphosphate hydrolase protein [Jimgerdemannia flammicorona]
MYTLLSGFYKYITRREEYYVVIVGLDNAGKTVRRPRTSLHSQPHLFLTAPSRRTDTPRTHQTPLSRHPRPGARQDRPDGRAQQIDIGRSRINFWDLGGQSELHSIWEKYYTECHAIVFVVDATDRSRIEEVKETFGTRLGFP